MIRLIFMIVAGVLHVMSKLTGRTYKEVNIIAYYFIIPLSWLVLLDVFFQFHYLKIAFVTFGIGFYIGCPDFKQYSDKLFKKSVDFLNYFNRFGSNYIASSVLICVFIPLLVYAGLIWLIL